MQQTGGPAESAELCKLKQDIAALEVLLDATEQELTDVGAAKDGAATSRYLASLRKYEAGLKAWSDEHIVHRDSVRDSSATVGHGDRTHHADISDNNRSFPTAHENRRSWCREEVPSTIGTAARFCDTSLSSHSLELAHALECDFGHHELPSLETSCATEEPLEKLSIFSVPTRIQDRLRAKSSPPSPNSSTHSRGGAPGLPSNTPTLATEDLLMPPQSPCEFDQYPDPFPSHPTRSVCVSTFPEGGWGNGESLQRSGSHGDEGCAPSQSTQNLCPCLSSGQWQNASPPFCSLPVSESDMKRVHATASAANGLAGLSTNADSIETTSCREGRRRASLQMYADTGETALTKELGRQFTHTDRGLEIPENNQPCTPSTRSDVFPQVEHREHTSSAIAPEYFALDEIFRHEFLHVSPSCKCCQSHVDGWPAEAGALAEMHSRDLFSPGAFATPPAVRFWENPEQHTSRTCTRSERLIKRLGPATQQSESRASHSSASPTQDACSGARHFQQHRAKPAQRGHHRCKQRRTPRDRICSVSNSISQNIPDPSRDCRRASVHRAFPAIDSSPTLLNRLLSGSPRCSPAFESNFRDIGVGASPTALEPRGQPCTHDACVGESSQRNVMSTDQNFLTAQREGYNLPITLSRVNVGRVTGTCEGVSEQVQAESGHPGTTEDLGPQNLPLTMEVSQQRCSSFSPGQSHAFNASNKESEELGGLARQPSQSFSPVKPPLGKANEIVPPDVAPDGGRQIQGEMTEEQRSDAAASVPSAVAVSPPGERQNSTRDAESLARMIDVELPLREERISRHTLCVELKEVQDMLLRLIDAAGTQPGTTNAGGNTLPCLPGHGLTNVKDAVLESTQGRGLFTLPEHKTEVMRPVLNSSHSDARIDSARLTTAGLPLTVADVTKKLQEDLSLISGFQESMEAEKGSCSLSAASIGSTRLNGNAETSSACDRAPSYHTRYKNCVKRATSGLQTNRKKPSSASADKQGLGVLVPATPLTVRTNPSERRRPGAGTSPLKFYKRCSSPLADRSTRCRISNPGADVKKTNKSHSKSQGVSSGSADSEISTCTTCYPVPCDTPHHRPHAPKSKLIRRTAALSADQPRSVSGENPCTRETCSSKQRTDATRFPSVSDIRLCKQRRPTFCSRPPVRRNTVTAGCSPMNNTVGPCCCASSCRCLTSSRYKRTSECSMRVSQSARPKSGFLKSKAVHDPPPVDCESPRHSGSTGRRSGSTGRHLCSTVTKMALRDNTTVADRGNHTSPRPHGVEEQVRSRCTRRGRETDETSTKLSCQCPRTRNQSTSPLLYRQQHCDDGASKCTLPKTHEQIRHRIVSAQKPYCGQRTSSQLLKRGYLSVWTCSDPYSQTRQVAFEHRPISTAALTLEASTCWSSPLSRIASGVGEPTLRHMASSGTCAEEKIIATAFHTAQTSTSPRCSTRISTAADFGKSTKTRRELQTTTRTERAGFRLKPKIGSRRFDNRARAALWNTSSVSAEERASPASKASPSKLHQSKVLLKRSAASSDLQGSVHQGLPLRRQCRGNSRMNRRVPLVQKEDLVRTTAGGRCYEQANLLPEKTPSRDNRGGCDTVLMGRALDMISTPKRPGFHSSWKNRTTRLPLVTLNLYPAESTKKMRKPADASPDLGPTCNSYMAAEVVLEQGNENAPVAAQRRRGSAGLYRSLVDRNCRNRRSVETEITGLRDFAASDRGQASPTLLAVEKRLPDKGRFVPVLAGRTQHTEHIIRSVAEQTRVGKLDQESSDSLRAAPTCSELLSLAKRPQQPVAPQNVAQRRNIAQRVREIGRSIIDRIGDDTSSASDSEYEHAAVQQKEGKRRACAGCVSDEESGRESDNTGARSPLSSDTLSASPIGRLERASYASSFSRDRVKRPNVFVCRDTVSTDSRTDFSQKERGMKEAEKRLVSFPQFSVRATVHASIKQRKSEEAGRVQEVCCSRDNHTSPRTSSSERMSIHKPSTPIPPADQLRPSRIIELHDNVTPDTSKPLLVDGTFHSAGSVESRLWESSLSTARFLDSGAPSARESDLHERAHLTTTAAKAIQWESLVTKEICSEGTTQLSGMSWCPDKTSSTVPTTVSRTTSQTDDLDSSQLTYVSDKDVGDSLRSYDYGSLSEENLLSDIRTATVGDGVNPRTRLCSFTELELERQEAQCAVSQSEGRKHYSTDDARLLASTDGIITTRRPILSRRAPEASSEHGSLPKSSRSKSDTHVARHTKDFASVVPPTNRRKAPPVLEFNMKSPCTQKENQ